MGGMDPDERTWTLLSGRPARAMPSGQRVAPKPHDYLYDEGARVTSWLAASYTPEQIREEWDYEFENGAQLHEIWMTIRWTTPEELADEDVVFDLFGDVEMNNVDTSVVYLRARAETPGAHRYWTVEP